ncbi:hypothetical protein [Streptomyces sp. NPDC093094]|uniref:hypothetical protein n=1 Tax=Streptomyces sp. NPDC093094 TaxID=3366026 RepID=UPI00382633C5
MREELDLLWVSAERPSAVSLLRHSDRCGNSVGRSTLAEVRKEDRTTAPSWATVKAFVEACHSYARARRKPLEPVEPDLLHWRTLYDRTYPSTRSRPAPPSAARPSAGWSPSDLDVHDALTVDAGPGAPLPPLPAYLRRRFDDELDQALAAAGERSVLVALTGGSSTGKTRALYEAVRRDAGLSARPLHYPRTAGALLDLVASGGPAPGTLLWLNEAQHLLYGESGEKVAEALRALFDSSRQGSVVALASMWPEYWDTLTAEPAPGAPDPHLQARQLLLHRARRIRVPDAFDPGLVAALAERADADPRLVLAAATAGAGRRVIQTLTGGPYLVDRYEHPQTNEALLAAAVLSAAVDLRRFGITGGVPHDLLTAAARDYLDVDAHDGLLPRDWTDAALDEATRRRHGIRALSPRREPPPDGAVVVYEVHDYLEQHGRARRHDKVPPDSFWQAVDDTRSVGELRALAEGAEARGRLRQAALLLDRAARRGDRQSAAGLAHLLDRAGRTKEAYGWWRCAAEAGDSGAMAETGIRLRRQGDEHAALRRWTAAAEAGDLRAPCLLAYHLEAASRSREARGWWNRAARANGEDYYVNRTIMDFLLQEGRADEAIAWAPRRCSYVGAHHGWAALARLLHRQGRTDEAITWWKSLLRDMDEDRGDHRAVLGEAADAMIAAGRADEAVSWLRGMADHGNEHARPEAVERMKGLGRFDEAVRWLKEHAVSQADAPGDGTVARVADLLVAEGRTAEALEWLERRAAGGDLPALVRATGLLQAQGRTEEALDLLTGEGALSFTDAADVRALRRTAGLLRAAGHRALALLLVQEAAQPGGHGHRSLRRPVERHVASRGDVTAAEAVEGWEEAYSALDATAMMLAVALLDATGAYEDVRGRLAASGVAGPDAGEGRGVRDWMRTRIDSGDPLTVVGAARAAVRSGFPDEALSAYTWLSDGGHVLLLVGAAGISLGSVAGLLERQGRVDEAVRHLLGDRGGFPQGTRRDAARILTRAGRTDDATALLLRHDDHSAVARLHADAGRVEEAVDALRRSADAGRGRALDEAVGLLDDAGRSDTARRLRAYGWNPDGTPATAWDAPEPPPPTAESPAR